MDNLFEKLTEIKKKEQELADYIAKIAQYPHLCFSVQPTYHKDGRMRTGTIARMDVPDDMGIKELVVEMLEARRLEYEKEFLSYKIQK